MDVEHQAYRTVVINAIRQETPGVKTFVLQYEDGSAIPYQAGQFITFVFSHHGREERRSFSISSCAALNEPLAITVKRIENGAYSRLLADKANVGDRLQITGVAGLFTLPEKGGAVAQFFFFAAGIGITPVFSLIRTLLLTETDKQIALIYSNRSREDVLFYDELNALAAAHPDRVFIEFLYSSSFNLSRARLSKELMPKILKEYARFPPDKLLFYLCGPFAYMRMVIISLEEMGIKGPQIRKENFNGSDRPVIKTEPPDKATHLVHLKYNGAESDFPVNFPESILAAAKRAGLSLPYSCEVGRCGSCVALCTQGKVWLSYNEVLMDSDIKNGKVLTCVGHPVNGDVWLEM